MAPNAIMKWVFVVFLWLVAKESVASATLTRRCASQHERTEMFLNTIRSCNLACPWLVDNSSSSPSSLLYHNLSPTMSSINDRCLTTGSFGDPVLWKLSSYKEFKSCSSAMSTCGHDQSNKFNILPEEIFSRLISWNECVPLPNPFRTATSLQHLSTTKMKPLTSECPNGNKQQEAQLNDMFDAVTRLDEKSAMSPLCRLWTNMSCSLLKSPQEMFSQLNANECSLIARPVRTTYGNKSSEQSSSTIDTEPQQKYQARMVTSSKDATSHLERYCKTRKNKSRPSFLCDDDMFSEQLKLKKSSLVENDVPKTSLSEEGTTTYMKPSKYKRPMVTISQDHSPKKIKPACLSGCIGKEQSSTTIDTEPQLKDQARKVTSSNDVTSDLERYCQNRKKKSRKSVLCDVISDQLKSKESYLEENHVPKMSPPAEGVTTDMKPPKYKRPTVAIGNSKSSTTIKTTSQPKDLVTFATPLDETLKHQHNLERDSSSPVIDACKGFPPCKGIYNECVVVQNEPKCVCRKGYSYHEVFGCMEETLQIFKVVSDPQYALLFQLKHDGTFMEIAVDLHNDNTEEYLMKIFEQEEGNNQRGSSHSGIDAWIVLFIIILEYVVVGIWKCVSASQKFLEVPPRFMNKKILCTRMN